MKRLWIMRIIALSIPLLFFVLLELSLRLFSYGADHRLFIENPQAPQYLLPRPDIIKKYFPPGAEVPAVTIETNFFKKEKPQDGLRIFVQGGSTAAGFPFGLGASIAGMLDYRLKQSFPDRPVEVVNTALSAVNSFTLLDFSDEIIAQKPDALLIYAGHNEYLGILGVGSSYSIASSYGSTLLFLKLRKLRTFQLLQHAYAGLSALMRASSDPSEDDARTTMAKIAKHKNIPKDSALYEAGKKQFRNNLDLLLAKYKKAGIPVFIASIASNIKDQRPFASSSVSAAQQAQATRFLALPANNNDAADPALLKAIASIAKTEKSAALFYRLGQVYHHQQNFTQAKSYFQLARDHDLLRFRAPTEFNDIIRNAASEHGAQLVDALGALEKNSPQAIVGSGLMLEHLHPNIDGYFLIADAFYEAIAAHAAKTKQEGVFRGLSNYRARDQARKEIPVFAAEKYWGLAKIANLVADYPFVEAKQAPALPEIKNWSDRLGHKAYQNKATWIDIATQTLKQSKNDPVTQAIALKLLSDALPYHAEYANQAGVGLIQLGRALEAPRYLKRAIEIEPKNTNYQLALIHALLLQQRVEEAQAWTRSVLAIDPNNQMAKEVAEKTGM